MDVLDTVIYTLDGQVMGLVLDDGVSAYQRVFEYHKLEDSDEVTIDNCQLSFDFED